MSYIATRFDHHNADEQRNATYTSSGPRSYRSARRSRSFAILRYHRRRTSLSPEYSPYSLWGEERRMYPSHRRSVSNPCSITPEANRSAQSPMDPNLPDGEHQWGTRPGATFRKEGHAVYVGGTATLAGSCCPLNECLQNLSTYASIPLPEAILTATMRPAQMLGPTIADHKGKLEEGFDADLCILGWDGSVKSTWIMGHEVWRTERLGDVGEGDYLGSATRGKEGMANRH